jgi:CheY-like chemotaxis protein
MLLLVDDSPEICVIIRHLARRAGLDVVTCPDVRSGWAQIQQQTPELVLLDVHLPLVGGLELCRQIRARPEAVRLPVALFSHWQLPEDIVAGIEAGIDFVVSKDLVALPADWQARIGEILAWTRGRRWMAPLSWLEEDALPSLRADWLARLNRVLRHSALRPLRPQGLWILLLRTLRMVAPPTISDTILHSWLLPEEGLLDESRCPPSLGSAEQGGSPDTRVHSVGPATVMVSLAERLWCLLGSAGTAPLWEAWKPILPGLEDLLTFR